jgi:hypothetical protein
MRRPWRRMGAIEPQANGKQDHGAGDGQGDPGGGVRCRPGEVEEMIQRRLVERRSAKKALAGIVCIRISNHQIPSRWL